MKWGLKNRAGQEILPAASNCFWSSWPIKSFSTWRKTVEKETCKAVRWIEITDSRNIETDLFTWSSAILFNWASSPPSDKGSAATKASNFTQKKVPHVKTQTWQNEEKSDQYKIEVLLHTFISNFRHHDTIYPYAYRKEKGFPKFTSSSKNIELKDD